MFIKAFILAVRERKDPYRAHIDATSMHRHNSGTETDAGTHRVHTHTYTRTRTYARTSPSLFIFTIYGSKQTVI